MIIAGTPWPCDASCLAYCAVADSNSNQLGWLDGGAKLDRSSNAADMYPVEIGFKATVLHKFIDAS